ncbi:hypothetical protein [Sphingomonas mali]|uniref:hypothetical protein n=1 Tax=Sphingomonas mali TaxID=40682 RepID=UPI00082B7088|nr:hypothetical protein [Sphingomonas mali]
MDCAAPLVKGPDCRQHLLQERRHHADLEPTLPLFPPALISCIGEARAPSAADVVEMAARVAKEVFPQDGGRRDDHRRQILTLAHVALYGADAVTGLR